nr:uncharacterized mitochondrial protein AtMg00810-like [Tanacetum cinerariifolium]
MHKCDILLVQMYVDDIIFGSTNKDLCKAFKKLMKDKFQMSLMRELTFFLGLQVKQKKDRIFISQDKYVADILRKFDLTDRKSASTPIDTDKPLLKDPDGEDVDVHTYRSMIGSLMYLTSSRPDIMFAVCTCARFQVTPKASHLHAVKWIFRYLKGKPHLGFWYPKDSPFNLVAYSDSDYDGASLDRKSTTEGCQFLGCRLISWQCKKQTLVATSSTEADPDQTVSGKDSSNPLMADNFPKIIWYSTHHVALMKSWLVQKQTTLGVNTPRCDEDRLEFMELMVFLLPSDEKVGIEVSAVDLQVSDVRLILLLCSTAVGVIAEGAASVADNEVPAAIDEPSIPSPTPPTPPPQPSQDQPSTSQVGTTQRIETSDDTVMDDVSKHGRMITDMDADVDVTLKDVALDAKIDESADVQGRKAESQAQIYQIDLEHADKVLSMQDDKGEPAELQEVVEVVTTAKLITEVVTAASATITAAALQLTTVAAPTLTTTHSAARRRKKVVIRDPEESATSSTIIHTEAKSKDKGKGILKEDNAVKRYQALKKKPQTKAQARKNMMIYLRNMAGFKMDYFKGKTYDDIRPIFKKYFNSNVAFLEKTKGQMEEEDSRALKRLSDSQKDKASKKKKLDEEVEELKKHLMIVPNDDDDVYTKATPIALNVPVVDFEIYTENNKPYYKIKRADGSHQLYMSFLSMLRNFDREDLEVLWRLVKERFASTKPKNFFDDFLMTTLRAMFEKPDIQAQI